MEHDSNTRGVVQLLLPFMCVDAQKFKAEFEAAQKAYGTKLKSEGDSKLGNESTEEEDEESDKLADDLDKLKVDEKEESSDPSKEDCSGTEKDCEKEQSTETSKVEVGVKADS